MAALCKADCSLSSLSLMAAPASRRAVNTARLPAWAAPLRIEWGGGSGPEAVTGL